jgi:putative flavoprotein involved in K+ transport
MEEATNTLVIGAGQGGLAAARAMARRGIDVLVLEENARIGDQWRRRWDSLRLFTPARWDGLGDMSYPGDPAALPSKDEIAEFLESTAKTWQLPVRTGHRVVGLRRTEDGAFDATVVSDRGTGHVRAARVIVASGHTRVANVPALASELDPAIVQLDASTYRRPVDVPDGRVLVVGAGNSGAEIAIELARAGRETILAGRDVGRIPSIAYRFGGRPFWFFATRVTDVGGPIGRRIAARATRRGTPIIGLDPRDITRAGVRRAPRVGSVRGGLPMLEDGTVVEAPSVVWCTGFRPDHSWIELPVLDADGRPRLHRGIADGVNNLAFMGVPFEFSLSSGLIGGAGRDAERVAAALLAERAPAAVPTERAAGAA